MSGPQFMHLQSFARKANKGGQSVEQVLGEAAREAVFCKHVVDPIAPEIVYGGDIETVRRQHDQMVEGGGVLVTLKSGKVSRRGIRKDRHTLLTAVASHPFPTELVRDNSDARASYEHWRDRNIVWLKQQFGSGLVSVIEHWDEQHPHIHAYVLPFDDPGCSARHLNPAWEAKETAMRAAKENGHTDKEAVKLGNVAYRERARELQDNYFENVSLPCGLTRTGPKRRRLSRQQWKAEKEAARRDAQSLKKVNDRQHALTVAKAKAEQTLKAEAQRLANTKRLWEDAHQRAERWEADAERAAKDAQRVREEVGVQQARLHEEQHQLAHDRINALNEVIEVVLQLVQGVVSGTVRPHPRKRSWVISDEDLRDRTTRLAAPDLVKNFLGILHDAWTSLAAHLSDLARSEAAEVIQEPIERGLRQGADSTPSPR